MSMSTHVPNVPQIADENADPGLRDVIERAKVTKSPPPAWYRTMVQNPEVAKEFARYWDMLHRGGTVPHEIKELARIQIAQIVGCEFCATAKGASAINAADIRRTRIPFTLPPVRKLSLRQFRILPADDGGLLRLPRKFMQRLLS